MRYFSLAVYRQKNGGVLAFIMMQGESSGTFDAALNPIGWRNATLLVNKAEAGAKGHFGDPPHAYFMKPSRNQSKTKN